MSVNIQFMLQPASSISAGKYITENYTFTTANSLEHIILTGTIIEWLAVSSETEYLSHLLTQYSLIRKTSSFWILSLY